MKLARQVSRIVVAKHSKMITLSMSDSPDDDTLLAHLLGPTGNLRAPTIRTGKTLVVGFTEQAYGDLLS